MKYIVTLGLLILSVCSVFTAKAENLITLDDIVLVQDYSDPEEPYSFPGVMLAHSGQAFLDRANIIVSANCEGFFVIKFEQNKPKSIYCAPKGDHNAAFKVADVERSVEESEGPRVFHLLKYDQNRVQLRYELDSKKAKLSYFLDIN
ncbi:MAG: hypothetical protein IT289_05585 [Oligoflexia bacterium]|nr:hypothetical protein [Oligoflexia bacterium]